MDWSAIRKIHSRLPATSEGWHQHRNGGGWVEDTAWVGRNCYVGPEALVCQFARVRGRVTLLDRSQAYGYCKVNNRVYLTDCARVFGHARVSDDVQVRDSAVVYGNAQVRGGVVVYQDAAVSGRARLTGFEMVRDVMHVSEPSAR